MNKINLILYSAVNLFYCTISLFRYSTPKPHAFCQLTLCSSLGGFNSVYLLTAQQLLDILGSILPYVLPIYLPLRHFITDGMRLPSIGYSSDTIEADSLNSDIIYPTINILPNRFLITNPYYQLYVDWLNFINGPTVALILLGLFVCILRSVNSLSINRLNTSNFLVIMFIFLLLIPSVSSSDPDMVIVGNNPFLVYTILSNLAFVIANYLFDYYSAQNRLRGILFFNSNIITRLILGILYIFNITTGVFATNGTWYLLSNYHTALITIFTTLGSILFPMLWFINGMENILSRSFWTNSVFRALLEFASFNCVAFSTYMYWDFWLAHVTSYTYWIAFSIFTPLILIVGFVTIYLESGIGRGRGLLYGIFYWLTFSCIAMSTNSAFALISEHIELSYINIILIVITSLLTILLYPDIYRAGVFMTRSLLTHTILGNIDIFNGRIGFMVFSVFEHLFLFYLVFLSFVLYTGLFFVYIYKWLTS